LEYLILEWKIEGCFNVTSLLQEISYFPENGNAMNQEMHLYLPEVDWPKKLNYGNLKLTKE